MALNKEVSNGVFPRWKQQIKAFDGGIKSLEGIKTLADKFDGKVINKRFVNAMNEITDEKVAIFSLVEKGYDYRTKINEKIISIYLTDRSFPTSKCTCGYIDEDRFDVREINEKDFYINGDGRLVKEFFIKALDDMIAILTQRRDAYQDCINNFDEYLDEVRKINNEIEELRKKVHYPMSIQTIKLELPFWYK